MRSITLLAACLSAGCQSPFDQPESDDVLLQGMHRALERELADAAPLDQRLQTQRSPSPVARDLSESIDELQRISPATPENPTAFSLGIDLTGSEQRVVSVNLQSLIHSAVSNNLGVQSSRLQPAIAEADIVAAEAVFDAVLFHNTDFSRIDEPTTVPQLGGVTLGTPFTNSENVTFETGIRRNLITGAQISYSTDLTRFRNKVSGFALSPDPAYTAAARVRVTQPLLRGFGSDVNQAQIQVSRNDARRSVQQLRSDLLAVADDTEAAYWNLVFAWRDLEIAQWLVDVGATLRDVLQARYELRDSTRAEAADAVATVEQRKADVIRARRAVRAASDELKRLVNDPALSVGSEVLLKPVDDLVDAPISYSLRDAIETSMRRRPEVLQAILNIDDASIRQLVADNNRLPILNLTGELGYYGLDDTALQAYDSMGHHKFIDYLAGLQFEMPIGNRAAEAEYRIARLQRSATLLAYQQSVQNVVLEVKQALRDVITNYELIEATRSFRIAQAENMRALEAREALTGLTAEAVNLRLQRQQGLANARQQELQALVNFVQAVSRLYRAMGIGLEMNNVQVQVVDEDDDSPAGPAAPDDDAS